MVSVRKSTIINAPVDQVWAIVRDYNGHDRWHPAVADSVLEDGRATDMIGAVRSFHLTSGEHLREQLLSLSDHDLTLSYCIVESPIPLLGYVAQIRLMPVTDRNATYWEWVSTFDTPAGQEQELAELVGSGVYTAGFDAIREQLEGANARSVTSAANVATSSTVPTNKAHVMMAREQSTPPTQSAATSSSLGHGADTSTVAATVLRGFGGPECLQTSTIALAAPQANEVQIRHSAIGVNYIDVYCRTGQFNLVEPDGGVPGLEAAGVVINVGEAVSDWKVGDRVGYATIPAGAYCAVRNLPADRLIRLPDDISEEVAAACLVKGLTAHFLLHEVHVLQPSETVLIHAAAGGVGLLLCQWAKSIGARVIGTVSNATKAALAREHGCDDAINYTETDFVAAVNQITQGEGVDLVIDGVGRDTFAQSLDVLKPCGHLISYGQASGPIGSANIDDLAAKSLTISRPNFGHYTDTASKIGTGAERLFDQLRRGAVKVRIDQRFALAEASKAHAWLESRQSTGSNLLLP